MARTKTPRKAKAAKPSSPSSASATASASSKTSRPLTGLYVAIFAAISGLCLWIMRIETVLADVPANFMPQVEAARYDNGLPMRTRYTGVAALDDTFRYLVLSFIAGPAGWDDGVRLQQIHFLVNFFAVVCVWNVEACRRRNAGRLISYTAIFACFYQTVGGAVIIPLYYLAYTLSSSSNAYYTSGREVALPYARGLLFAAVVGYLVPTIALYIPWFSFETTQLLTMVWQPAPLFVNLLLFLSSLILPSSSSSSPSTSSTTTSSSSSTTPSKPKKNADIKHLKRLYLIAGLISALTHLTTLYLSLTSSPSNPSLALRRIFLPSTTSRRDSTVLGLHYIFQVDWWGIFAPTLLWAWVAVCDVMRILLKPAGGDKNNHNNNASSLLAAVYIACATVVLGPGAALALVWSWREDRLAMIEDGVRGTIRKPKPKSA